MMNTHLSNLSKILDFEKWQKIQDFIAKALNLAIITVDYKGIPVTTHSCCSNFCKTIRNDFSLSKYCQKCDSRGGLEAVRTNAPYMYLCHYNLVDLAIPIIVDNKYLGAIMAGQVRLTNLPNGCELEAIIPSLKNYSILENNQALYNAYEKIPYLSYHKFLQYADVISSISDYVVTEAIEKLTLENTLETYINGVSINSPPATPRTGFNIPQKETPHPVITPETPTIYSMKGLIEPALDYIHTHHNVFLSSKEASILCNISSSYFSRIFKKVMGQNYTDYIIEQKLIWAKEVLVETNESIEKISESLGFGSSSYFSRLFKKHENLTPSLYRKYYKH